MRAVAAEELIMGSVDDVFNFCVNNLQKGSEHDHEIRKFYLIEEFQREERRRLFPIPDTRQLHVVKPTLVKGVVQYGRLSCDDNLLEHDLFNPKSHSRAKSTNQKSRASAKSTKNRKKEQQKPAVYIPDKAFTLEETLVRERQEEEPVGPEAHVSVAKEVRFEKVRILLMRTIHLSCDSGTVN